jgi:hypothetical protein
MGERQVPRKQHNGKHAPVAKHQRNLHRLTWRNRQNSRYVCFAPGENSDTLFAQTRRQRLMFTFRQVLGGDVAVAWRLAGAVGVADRLVGACRIGTLSWVLRGGVQPIAVTG